MCVKSRRGNKGTGVTKEGRKSPLYDTRRDCFWLLNSVSFCTIWRQSAVTTLVNPKVHCVRGASCFCSIHPAQQQPTMQAAVVTAEQKQETLFTQPDFQSSIVVVTHTTVFYSLRLCYPCPTGTIAPHKKLLSLTKVRQKAQPKTFLGSIIFCSRKDSDNLGPNTNPVIRVCFVRQ